MCGRFEDRKRDKNTLARAFLFVCRHAARCRGPARFARFFALHFYSSTFGCAMSGPAAAAPCTGADGQSAKRARLFLRRSPPKNLSDSHVCGDRVEERQREASRWLAKQRPKGWKDVVYRGGIHLSRSKSGCSCATSTSRDEFDGCW